MFTSSTSPSTRLPVTVPRWRYGTLCAPTVKATCTSSWATSTQRQTRLPFSSSRYTPHAATSRPNPQCRTNLQLYCVHLDRAHPPNTHTTGTSHAQWSCHHAARRLARDTRGATAAIGKRNLAPAPLYLPLRRSTQAHRLCVAWHTSQLPTTSSPHHHHHPTTQLQRHQRPPLWPSTLPRN